MLAAMIQCTPKAICPQSMNLLYPAAGAQAIIKVSDHQHWWLAGGYDLEIGLFRGGYYGV